jgi:hypothetical protein
MNRWMKRSRVNRGWHSRRGTFNYLDNYPNKEKRKEYFRQKVLSRWETDSRECEKRRKFIS